MVLVCAALVLLCIALGFAASDSAAPIGDRTTPMVASDDAHRADTPKLAARERGARERAASNVVPIPAPALGPTPSRHTVRSRIQKTDPTQWLERYGEVEVRQRSAP